MSSRIVHRIMSECDIQVQRVDGDIVRIRITEKNPDVSDPADFEIEGNVDCISQAFGLTASVLSNLDDLLNEAPN